MIRLILVLLIAILYLVIGCIPAFILWLIGKKNPDLKDRISRRMIQWIFGVLLFVSGTKVKAEGLENIPKDRAVLYVGNHRSYFDIITSYRLLPGITGYVAKKEMAKVPLLRLWMRYIHCLFLDRSNVKEGLKTILAGVDELKNGHSIWIFPFIRRAAITIRFGEPIDLKSLPREQKKQAGAYTRTIIQAMLDDILKED